MHKKRGKSPQKCIFGPTCRKLIRRGKKLNLKRGGGDDRNEQYLYIPVALSMHAIGTYVVFLESESHPVNDEIEEFGMSGGQYIETEHLTARQSGVPTHHHQHDLQHSIHITTLLAAIIY